MAVDDAFKDALKAYMKRADDILKDNIRLVKEEQAIAEKRKALEAKELAFIQELEDIGLQSLHLTSGYVLSIKENYHCNINKNLADRDNVASWLRAHGGENLVKASYSISEKDANMVKELGIDVIENVDMNTTSVKAFVKSGLGLSKDGMQQFEISDLPKGLHFFTEKQIHIG